MKILITGHSGFIGKYLQKILNDQNFDLVFASNSNGVDVSDWNQVKNFCGFDVIIHLANLSFVPQSYKNPLKFYQTNYLSTLNMLELCRINEAKFIFLSSYIYGRPLYQPIDEGHPTSAFNPYAQTKVICESLCEGYNRDFEIAVDIFRPFNIYGTGQNSKFLIPSIILQAQKGIIKIKDENPKRDYIHVEDIVRAIKASIDNHSSKETKNSSSINFYNLGLGESHSVKEIIDIVKKISVNNITYECTNEKRPNEIMDTKADISKAQKDLNWEPKIGIEEGLQKMMSDISSK